MQGNLEVGGVRSGDNRTVGGYVIDEASEIGVDRTGNLGSEVRTPDEVELEDAGQSQMGIPEHCADVVHAHASRADNHNTRR